MAQNRKFQDFVETKYMADDAIGNAELENTMQKTRCIPLRRYRSRWGHRSSYTNRH